MTTRVQAFQAVNAALRTLSPGDPARAAEIGVEACLLAVAAERGTDHAAKIAYDLADALATAGRKPAV